MKKVLVTGATGLIGENFCALLAKNNIEPLVLSRGNQKTSQYRTFEWNLQKDYIDKTLFDEKIDAIIHLAGSNIADKRWTKARKQEIIESRVAGLRLLGRYFEKMPQNQRPKSFISAAAIGIYGNAGSDWVDENTPIQEHSSEFLVQSCMQWEAATAYLSDLGIRTAILRIGIVLSKNGGALEKLLPSYKLNIGTYFGSGKQFYAWIHLDDISRMLLFLLQNEHLTGVFNGVAPHPVSNKELAATLAKALNKKALLIPVPTLFLTLAMGEMAVIITGGAKVAPTRIMEAGFECQFPELLPALQDLLRVEG